MVTSKRAVIVHLWGQTALAPRHSRHEYSKLPTEIAKEQAGSHSKSVRLRVTLPRVYVVVAERQNT